MAIIIKELWHGSNSNNFGLFGCSTNYKIITSGYDAEESKRLFVSWNWSGLKTYVFQYQLWPESCSLWFTATSLLIMLLAVFW